MLVVRRNYLLAGLAAQPLEVVAGEAAAELIDDVADRREDL